MSSPHAPVPDTRHDILVLLLTSEYSSELLSEMNRPVHLHHLRREQRLRNLNDAARRSAADRADWPKVVPNDTILSCCRDYYNATMWTTPPMCASCARRRPFVPLIELVTARGLPPPCNLELLRLTDHWIIQRSIVNDHSNQFSFNDEVINGLMLHRDGLRQLEDGSTIVFLCPDCHSSLTHEKVPRFALKNDLYRGRLPEESMDLTWVEEMVCSLC
ncbi:hypothetical protein JB92DRAFT_2931120 [Gautieria morchelliformis]|nr:hypothetical protein JB92DRAFT_2931120 [Gautieria morchelliformis]